MAKLLRRALGADHFGWDAWILQLKNGTDYRFGDTEPLEWIDPQTGDEHLISFARAQFNPKRGPITLISGYYGRDRIEIDYDANGRATQARDSYGRTVNYAYDASGRLIRVTDAAGGVTECTYDACGKTASAIRLAGTPQAATWSFTYQAQNPPTESACINVDNQLTSVTDPLGHTTSFTWGGPGLPRTITDALGNVTNVLSWGLDGLITGITNPLQKTWQLQYSNLDLTAVTGPLGNRSEMVVDEAGRVARVRNPLGHTWLYDYDALNPFARATFHSRSKPSL